MNIAAFNWLDYTALGLILFSTLISFARGFVREAISLATWILAIWIAYKYGHDFGESFLTMIESDQARSLLGSAVLFFGVLLLGALINYLINQFVHLTGLSAIDRILGMAFGFARGILLVAVLILVAQITQFDKKSGWSESQTIPLFSGVSEWLKSFVPEQFEKLQKLKESPEKPGTTPGQPVLGDTLPQAAAEVAKQAITNTVTQLQ